MATETSAPAGDRLDRWAASAPFAIVVYALLLLAARVALSDQLEVDEAEFVGQVDFRLLYENSHPPLFNWLLRLALTFSDWDWAWSVALVKYALLGAFHWLSFDTARRLAGPRAGLMALAASAAAPQIVWMSAFTLAHSIMAMTGVAALVNAALRVWARPSARNYVWLGLAGALAALGKFNAFLFIAAFLAALALAPALRARIFSARRAWIAAAAFLVPVGPVIAALLLNFAQNTERLAKLYAGRNLFSAIDPPGLGVDGLFALGVALIAWAGPAALVWFGARRLAAETTRGAGDPDIFVAALARAMRWSLIGLALVVLMADAHKAPERYLTPMLAALPVYLAVRWPLGRAAARVALVALVVYLAVPVGLWGAASFGKHRFGYPYSDVAAHIAQLHPKPLPIVASRHDDAANVILKLGWPGARAPAYQPIDRRLLLLWQGRSDAPENLAPQGFRPAGPIITVAAPFINRRPGQMVFRFQLFEWTDG